MQSEVSTLFGELSGVSPKERERYYATHSVPEELRREVESLLSFDSGPPIANIVHTAVGLVFQEPVSDGDFCGPFQLLRLIGRGGMGVVYLAERVDGEVRQRVAVKLLRSALDSSAARQRFLQERQILASLAHPNIARLIDAGHRADGHPFLVMEYIEGRPIDEHCQTLSVREKVALISTVCEAIASAHQKLIVHRDLKPGNILVDHNGNPCVLDFGIAKLMDESDATATVERRLTPEYASPEQLMGAQVTTASDIYSLGAVLYKLLTGEAPARATSSPTSRTCATEDRDLAAIVSKTIRTEPHERYTTADKLADDLRAWLDHRPVAARQGERWYRAQRQLRRYWAPAAAGLIAASGLIGGIVAARTERDDAQRRFDEVRKLANEFFAIERDMAGLTGATAIRERMVKTSIKYLEGLSKRAGNDWGLKAEIASGYRKAAEAQGISLAMNLGRPADARASLDKAAALLAEVSAAAPGNRAVLHDRIELMELQTRLEWGSQNFQMLDAKINQLRELLARYEAGAKDELAEWQFVGRAYESMAVTARALNRMELPIMFAKRCMELRQKAAERDKSITTRGNLANSYSTYGGLLRATGDLTGAVEMLQQSLAVFEQIAASNPDHYKVQVNIANTHAAIARTLGDANGPSLRQTEAAVKHFEESLRLGRRLMALDPDESQIRYNHSLAAWRLGDALRTRDPRTALARYDEAIEVLRPLSGQRYSRDVPLVAALAESTFALRVLDRHSEIKPRLQEAAGICGTHRGEATTVYETCSEFLSRAEAATALSEGRPLEAVAAHREWLKLIENEKTLAETKEDIYSAYVLTRRYRLLRNALLSVGMKAEADEEERKRLAVVELWKKKLSGRNNAEAILAGSAVDRDQIDVASQRIP